MTALADDRSLARELRRHHPLPEVVARLKRLAWGPKRIALALDLAESYVFTLATGREPPRARARPLSAEVADLAASLSTTMAAALHTLVVESRGLWAVDTWPTPAHTVRALVDRRLARLVREGQWEPTRDGCDADALRHRALRAVHNPASSGV